MPFRPVKRKNLRGTATLRPSPWDIWIDKSHVPFHTAVAVLSQGLSRTRLTTNYKCSFMHDVVFYVVLLNSQINRFKWSPSSFSLITLFSNSNFFQTRSVPDVHEIIEFLWELSLNLKIIIKKLRLPETIKQVICYYWTKASSSEIQLF